MRRLAMTLGFALFSLFCYSQCDDLTEVISTSNTGGWGYEMSWYIEFEDGTEVASFQGEEDDTETVEEFCFEDGCYTLIGEDTYGDGWNGGSLELDISGTVLNFEMTEGTEAAWAFGVNTEGCIVVIFGCTDPEAINYNPIATEDDGSCTTIEGMLELQSITSMIASGNKDNRINWGIQNRGMPNSNDEFDSEEEFHQFMEEGLLITFDPDHPDAKTPYAAYRNFFNLDTWWWPEAPTTETGWSWQLLKGMRDAYYLPWADDEHGWATLFSTSKWGGGGGAGTQPDTRTGDGLMYGMEWETLLHEFAHTMPQIPDEYTSSGVWSNGQCWEGANTSGHLIADSIPWRLWLEPGIELPTPYNAENEGNIGAFEGALTNYFGCHRPTAKGCYMGAGGFGEGYGQDLCAPCIQRVICHLYKYVDVIENPLPENEFISVNGNETITFSAAMVKPDPNTQVYRWLLNGELIAEGTEEIEVTFGACDSYELTLTVEDTTSLVRYDAHFNNIYPRPFESRTWYIDQLDVDEYDLSAEAFSSNVDCTTLPTGEVTFDVMGGTGSVTPWHEGVEVSNPHAGLVMGEYTYWLVDDEGCGVEVDALVEEDDALDVVICSEWVDDAWTLTASASGYPEDDLSVSWSGGESGFEVSGLPDGFYSVEVTTTQGCTVFQEVNVSQTSSALSVNHTFLPATTAGNDGRIDLEISGGEEAYTVEWYEKLMKDLTAPNSDQIEASGDTWGHIPENAFDNDLDTKWLHFVSEDAWISYEFEEPQVVTFYSITSGDDVEERDPKDWVIEGSNNGTDWTVVDSRQDEDFPARKQRRLFLMGNEDAYQFYRLWVLENNGDGSIQLQQLEFIGVDDNEEWTHNPNADNMISRTDLAPGEYEYLVQDQNSNCSSAETIIGLQEEFIAEGLIVVQDGPCAVKIEEPQSELSYYWLTSEDDNEILHIGDSFNPPSDGNFWVAAVDNETQAMSSNRPGFAVTMPQMPDIEEISDGMLGVVDPDPELIYKWYDAECLGNLVHQGEVYEPGDTPVELFVASWWADPFPAPLNPNDAGGIVVRMDAADLDGDGQIDDPQPPTSSLYDWLFSPSNGITESGWFAYRSNWQNGLGIADFATMWLQGMDENVSGYRTIIMAYEENGLSWEGTAPFEGLDEYIPYSGNPEESLYASDAPAQTLAGSTWLNGDEVDPLTTPNPMEFCILGTAMTNEGDAWMSYTHTHWEGKLGELILFEDELDDDEMIGVSEFLRRKWISTADLESLRTFVDWDGTGIGVNDVVQQRFIEIFPNPVDERTMLNVSFHAEGRRVVTLRNIEGTLIRTADVPSGPFQMGLSSWTNNLSGGAYLISVVDESSNSWTRKLVVR